MSSLEVSGELSPSRPSVSVPHITEQQEVELGSNSASERQGLGSTLGLVPPMPEPPLVQSAGQEQTLPLVLPLAEEQQEALALPPLAQGQQQREPPVLAAEAWQPLRERSR